MFFLMEWATVCALDWWYGRLNLRIHPHCLPRQADLSRRSRSGDGDSDRCTTQCVDVVTAFALLSITAAEFTAKSALHIAVVVIDAPSYAGHVAATHLICAYLGTRRYLAKFGWLMYLLGDVAWLELEHMVSSWLQFDLLGYIGRLLVDLSCLVMVCNAGGRLWRRARRLLRSVRLQRHERSLWKLSGAAFAISVLQTPSVFESFYRAAADWPVADPFPLLTPSHFSQDVGWSPAEMVGQRPSSPPIGKCFIARRSKNRAVDAQGRAYDRVRAKAAVSASKRKEPLWKSVVGAVWISIIVDSGCTWHSHPDVRDLVNVRECHERIACADGVEHACTAIGDLPLVSLDEKGREHTVLLRDVRCVPSFTDTLISIEQLWSSSSIDVVFRNRRCLVQVDSDDKELVALPFKWYDGLYHWDVGAVARASLRERPPAPAPRPRALRSKDETGVHGSHATSHINALSPNEAANVLHRRLHVSLDRIKRLVKFTADAPPSLAQADHVHCDACSEANAIHLPHGGSSSYTPSHAGRLVHADIVGPFTLSVDGHFQWMLVLVDDHTRFKFVYFMKKKSEAPQKISKFVAKFNAHASKHASSPVRVVGSLHTDNAGEFLSTEFKYFLDEASIDHTTCPPHVHQLNGVAERAIRSIMDLTRVELLSSGLTTGFWTFAATHAVDILNRTTGAPKSDVSSFESLTGERPRIMPILPLGCRSYVVKSDGFVRKTGIPPRAWKGVNLGRSPTVPGAYSVFVKSTHRVHVTSDVYFSERYFPNRPKGQRHVGPEAPARPPADVGQPPGLPPVTTVPSPAPTDVSPPPPPPSPPPTAPTPPTEPAASIAEAFEQATRRRSDTARSSRHVLILFSGPYERPDGLAAFLRRVGLEVTLVDNDVKHGGNAEHDIANDAFYQALLERAQAGEFLAVIAAPPCSTFSISRFIPHPSSPDGRGPPIVRNKNHPEGLPDVPAKHRRELRHANRLVQRMTYIVGAAYAAGSEYIIENPPHRGDASLDYLFMHAQHAALWQMPIIK